MDSTDPGESELLGVSDWGVTDKGSHSLLETVSNQILWKKLASFPGLPHFLLFGVLYWTQT